MSSLAPVSVPPANNPGSGSSSSPSTTTTSTSKRIIIKPSDWDVKLNDVAVSKSDLNRLVMDYLVVEGYREAAENFAREAGMPPQPDFESIHHRMAIRNAIQRGDIVEAIEQVNDLNPEILDNNPSIYFHLQQQRLIELIRDKKVDEALLFAQHELAPRGEEHPEFLSELEETMTLLAYDVDLAAIEKASSSSNKPISAEEQENILGNTPSFVVSLLHPSHRQATAAQVNAAILTSQNRGPTPKLPNLLRMLAWGESLLHEKADFPKLETKVNTMRSAAGRKTMASKGAGNEDVAMAL